MTSNTGAILLELPSSSALVVDGFAEVLHAHRVPVLAATLHGGDVEPRKLRVGVLPPPVPAALRYLAEEMAVDKGDIVAEGDVLVQ